ncbi:MAG TPA: aquaporin [Vicinamibacterales bacterium]|nr:aquaporin [Vicinamibacterales bacterium]
MSRSLHWREYLIEAIGLGLFMVSAAFMTTLLEHPSSPIRLALPDPFVRRALMGLAMGLTAASLIYSPWGRRSGAHFNPSVTLTFFRLGKVSATDAAGYVAAQFVGGTLGIAAAAFLLRPWIANAAVNYVATQPGPGGDGVAFFGELAISFLLMLTVLTASNRARLARFTGLFAAALVASFIAVEAPLSGMSMNPARTFGPSLVGGLTHGLWLYFVAPPLGMLAAAELYTRIKGRVAVHCARLQHTGPCIFCNAGHI